MRQCTFCQKKITLPHLSLQLGDRSLLCSKCSKIIPEHLHEYASFYWNMQDYMNAIGAKNNMPAFNKTDKCGNLVLDSFNGLFYNIREKDYVQDMKYITKASFQFIPVEIQQKKTLFSGNKQQVIGNLVLKIEATVPKQISNIIVKNNTSEQVLMDNQNGTFVIREIKYRDEEQDFISSFFQTLNNIAQNNDRVHQRQDYETNNDTQYQERTNNSRTQKEENTYTDIEKAMAIFLIDSLEDMDLEGLRRQRNKLLKTFHTDNGEPDVRMSQKINKAYEVLKTHIG